MDLSIVKKLILVIVLPLIGVALWYYPLLLSLSKPVISQHGITQVLASVRPEDNKRENNSLSYDALGISAPITMNENTSPLRTSDWESIRESLRKGISVAYEGNSFESSSLVFATGHSSDTYPHAYASVFAGLGSSNVGDSFTLVLDNKLYDYKVVDKKVIHPNDVQSFKELNGVDSGKQRVVLVTCWPVLTTKERMVIIGERSI